MAINKKLITFDKKLTFLGANGINNLSSPVDGYYNLIPTWSMVFIKDTGEIWHDGVYFGKPIKDQIAPIMQGTTKGLVFTPDGESYYYKTFNLWGNTFDGDTMNINGDLEVQGETYKWTYGDASIKKGNVNLIAFSNNANNYDVFIPNGSLKVTGGSINVNNGKAILDSTGSIKGTYILNTNSYFNADNTLGKTWSSIKLFNTSGTAISLDTTRPAIINIQEHAHASGTLWVPWIAGGDITELSSWGIGLGGDAFYIGRIAKSHTENSLSQYWKFDAEDGITISGTTKYIKVADLSGASEKIFMADGTVKAISDLASEALIGEATTTNYGGFKLTQAKASSQQSLVANTTGNGRYAVKMNANGTLYVEFSQANTWIPATNSQEGYVPQLSGENDAIGSSLNDYVLTFTSSDAETIYPTWRRLPSNAFDNTWRGIYVDNTSKLGTGTTTKPINFKAGNGVTLTFTAAGDNVYNTLQIDGTTYSTATDSTLGLVKVGTTLDNVTGFTAVHIKDGVIYYKDTTYSFSNLKFQLISGTDLMTYNSQSAKTILAGTGITFSYLNNVLTISSDVYSTATSSILGLVKVGTTLEDTTGYTKVHIDDSGFIYYHDTTYSFSKLKFQQTSGTDLMTYDSQSIRTILAGDNVTFTHSNNVLTIKATDTTYSAATSSTLGLIKVGPELDSDSGYTKLHIKGGVAYYHDTTYSFSKLKFLLTAGTDLMTYDSLAARTIVAGDNITFTHSSNVLTIKATDTTYSNFTAATASVAGKAGLVPGPTAGQLGSDGYYLRADGTWATPTGTWKEVSTSQEGYVPKIVTTGSLASSDNPFILVYKNVSGTTKSVWVPLPANAFNDTWTAADFTNAGYVPKSIKGKFLHAKSDTGALEWVDDNDTWDAASTSKAGYVPKLATGGGTIASSDTAYVLAYKSGVNGTTAPTWMLLPSNAYDNTWTAMVGATASANGTVGYVNATPPKDGYNTKFLRADGTWSVPAYPTKASWNYDDKYITLVGVTDDNTNHKNLLRYVLNGTSNYFTVPYSTTSGTSDATYFLYARSSALESAGVQFIQGQIKTGSSDNQAYSGSSSNFKVLSFPPNATCINNQGTANETANIGIFRIAWGTVHWHDLHFSPNDNNIYHRVVFGSNPIDWRIVVETTGNKGNSTKPVYVSGGLVYECDAYPTKASWNYDDIYVSSLGTSGNYLTWTKDGTTNNITVPYASDSDKLDGWDNTKFCKVYTRAEIGETPNFDDLKDVDGNQVNGFFESRVAETTNATGKKPPYTSCAPMLSFKHQHVSLQLMGKTDSGWYIRGALGANVANSNASTDWERLVTNSGTWDISITGNAATATVTDTIKVTDKSTHPSSGSESYYIPMVNTYNGNGTIYGSSDFFMWRSNDSNYLNIGKSGITSGITFHRVGETSGAYGNLVSAACTDLRTWTLPNATGTIALTSDIPTKNSWNYDDRYLSLSSGGTVSGNITANSFIKSDSSNDYILLAGGGDLLIDNLYSKVANLLKGSYKYTKSNPLTRTATRSDDYVYYTDLNFDAVAGETYVISCETDGNWVDHNTAAYGASDKACGFWLYSASDTHYSFGPNMPAVWTAPKTANYHVRINMYTINSSYTLHFWNMKVERGRRATDWLICTDDPWHRALTADSVAWSGITSKPNATGDATHPVYWTGSGFTLANAYPTKSSWNYDDVYSKLGHNHNSDYVQSVSISGDNLRVTKNSSNSDLTIPYASSSSLLRARSNITSGGVLYIVGQIAFGTSANTAYWGSSSNFNLMSVPPGGTSDNNGTMANVAILRIDWGTAYWHDLHFSPNNTGIFHRSSFYGTAYDWRQIVETIGNKGGSTTPVYVSGGLVYECTSYANASVSYADSAGSANSVAWGNVSSKPTKISLTGSVIGSVSLGVGDLTLDTTTNHSHSWDSVTGKPCTLVSYGRNSENINANNWRTKQCSLIEIRNTELTYSNLAMSGYNSFFNFWTPDGIVCTLFLVSNGAFYYRSKLSATAEITTSWYRLMDSNNCSVSKSGETLTVTINGTSQSLTNTNTWRGIQNNLTSDSTTDSLSAAQGKALNAKFGSYLPLAGETMNSNSKIIWNLFGTSYIGSGIADGADDSHYNITIGSWYGFALTNTCPGGDRLAAGVPAWLCNVRYGNTTLKGSCTATNFYTTSDRIKKQNISLFSEHIRKFQLKNTEKWHYGVIAQEVEEMFREGEEGNMTVNYNSILSFYIGQLENRVKELEEKIKLLETK